jgi:hypothetical protein
MLAAALPSNNPDKSAKNLPDGRFFFLHPNLATDHHQLLVHKLSNPQIRPLLMLYLKCVLLRYPVQL